jgi:signal transduction histidine kinase
VTTAAAPRRSPWWPLGLRREVLILMPVSLLLLIALSTFTLLSYRNAVDLLAEERRQQAAHWAGRLAEQLSSDLGIGVEALLRQVPEARSVTLVGPDGLPLAGAGTPSAMDWLTLVGADPPEQPRGYGPSATLIESVVGVAPLVGRGGRRYVRVDLAAPILAAQRRSLPLLSAVVLGINGALGVLLILFLRHLLVPYETLLERARQLGGPAEDERDETALLISTFERAVEALTTGSDPGSGGGEDDELVALERTLSVSLESGVLLLDRQGDLLSVNPVGSKLLSLPAESSGAPLEKVLGAYPELLRVLVEAVAGRRAIQRQEIDVETSGGQLTLGLSVHPLRRDDGAVRGFLVLFADLTEIQRRAAEVRREESLTQLGELAAGVAHELRNSLSTLRGYLTLIERSPDEESIGDYLAEIRHESDQLQRILEDFLSFARPGAVRFELLRLQELLRRAVADPSLGGVKIGLHGAAAESWEVHGDPDLLAQAVRNLLQNAAAAQREAGAEGGEIEVWVRRAEDGIEVSIEDRGPGVPPELRERLFQPFVSGRPAGVGLGLAISHRIVTLHGGRLRLEDREGGGTRARILLPR